MEFKESLFFFKNISLYFVDFLKAETKSVCFEDKSKPVVSAHSDVHYIKLPVESRVNLVSNVSEEKPPVADTDMTTDMTRQSQRDVICPDGRDQSEDKSSHTNGFLTEEKM